MKNEKLKEVFKKAAEIAKVVPEVMQPIAFNRAVELLLGESKSDQAKQAIRVSKKPKGVSRPVKDESVKEIVDKLDRTKYPYITGFTKVLERSLGVLKIAQDEFGVDGLIAPQIAKILKNKFRLGVSRQAIYEALEDASTLVDRSPSGVGKAHKYTIMHPGEEHLKKAIEKLKEKNN